MANIPVERTAGTPWWLWLLGLLLLAGLIWFLVDALGDDDDADVYADDDIEAVDDFEAVDDMDDVAVAGTMATGLDLSSLYVTRVTGDRTFFVAPSESMQDDETLVILDQEASAAPGIEGQVDINPGQTISIDSELSMLGDMDLMNMGIPDADLNMMTPDTQIIRADGDDVEILDADMRNVEVGE